MVQPITPFGKILHDNPHLAKALELLEMLPGLESIDDTASACLELGRQRTLSKMARQELLTPLVVPTLISGLLVDIRFIIRRYFNSKVQGSMQELVSG